MTVTIAPAEPGALDALHALIERAYRGETARAGWTHEADLLEGRRIERATLAALFDAPSERILAATSGNGIVGCVHVSDRKGGVAYLGLLTVEPGLQAEGLGKRLLQAAEADARTRLGARTMELTVVSRRPELIAYYARRGYAPTGEVRPFPVTDAPHLELAVMSKPLA